MGWKIHETREKAFPSAPKKSSLSPQVETPPQKASGEISSRRRSEPAGIHLQRRQAACLAPEVPRETSPQGPPGAYCSGKRQPLHNQIHEMIAPAARGMGSRVSDGGGRRGGQSGKTGDVHQKFLLSACSPSFRGAGERGRPRQLLLRPLQVTVSQLPGLAAMQEGPAWPPVDQLLRRTVCLCLTHTAQGEACSRLSGCGELQIARTAAAGGAAGKRASCCHCGPASPRREQPGRTALM